MSKYKPYQDPIEPEHDTTVKEAMSFIKGLGKFVSYAVLIGSAVVYVTKYMDRLDASLERLNATLAYKASIADVNHLMKVLQDTNTDVVRHSGGYGISTPELAMPAAKNGAADGGGN